MGSVYAGIQPVIGKRVAIKVLAPHIASNPELVRRFVDEARAVNKIGHPNIVDIFSFGWLPDKRHYFAMEFLDGQSLADRLKQGPFQPDEARRLLRQICQALEAAHRQGIVHRDLKPDNIWIVQPQHGDSYAKLLDFGIAKLMGDVDEGQRTQTGIVMGTPAYMSPEQCRGVNVERGTDIYALGMILYEMFAGQLPFKGSFAELITHHLITVPERAVAPSADAAGAGPADPALPRQGSRAAAADRGRAVARARGGAARAGLRGRGAAAPGRAAGAATGAHDGSARRHVLAAPGADGERSDDPARPAARAAGVGAGGGGRRGDRGSRSSSARATAAATRDRWWWSVDAQPPPADAGRPSRCPGARTSWSKGSMSRACWSTASWWRPACARRASWIWRRASRTRCASRPSIGRRTSACSPSPRARRRSWRFRSRRRRPPSPTSRPRRAGRQDAPSRHRGDARDHPDDAPRRPRQSPDTATAWSATTSSTASDARDFSASRLASRARRCFDRGACRA